MNTASSAAARPRACPLCDAAEASLLWRKGELRVVRCLRCRMAYASPISADLTDGASYERRSESYYLSAPKLAADYAPVRFDRELHLFRQFCAGGRVLDAGCSTGAFLHQLETRWPGAYSLLGTDVAAGALAHAGRQGLHVRAGHFLALDFGPEQFDAVTFWAVIEHLAEPRHALQKAATLLRPGGHCFVLVPNLASLAMRSLGPRYRYVMPDHLNYFNRATLRAFAATEPRLQVAALRATHFNPVVIWQDFRRGGEAVADEDRAALLERTTAWKQRPWLKPARAVYGAVEWLLGRCFLADNLVAVLRRV